MSELRERIYAAISSSLAPEFNHEFVAHLCNAILPIVQAEIREARARGAEEFHSYWQEDETSPLGARSALAKFAAEIRSGAR